MGIKGTLEWKSLDNVFNFFQEADDSNLLSLCACKINLWLFRIDCFFVHLFELDSIQACLQKAPHNLNTGICFQQGSLTVLDTAVGLWEEDVF